MPGGGGGAGTAHRMNTEAQHRIWARKGLEALYGEPSEQQMLCWKQIIDFATGNAQSHVQIPDDEREHFMRAVLNSNLVESSIYKGFSARMLAHPRFRELMELPQN